MKRLDIRELSRRDLLTRESCFVWSWNRGGEPTGSINVSVQLHRAVSLVYTVAEG